MLLLSLFRCGAMLDQPVRCASHAPRPKCPVWVIPVCGRPPMEVRTGTGAAPSEIKPSNQGGQSCFLKLWAPVREPCT
jgi:hypothetical protein